MSFLLDYPEIKFYVLSDKVITLNDKGLKICPSVSGKMK